MRTQDEILEELNGLIRELRGMVKVVVRKSDIRMTCSASPSQWEGETVTGESVYIRYRWGFLSVQSPLDSYNGKTIFGEQIRDDMDGCMEAEEMYALTADVIKWID